MLSSRGLSLRLQPRLAARRVQRMLLRGFGRMARAGRAACRDERVELPSRAAMSGDRARSGSLVRRRVRVQQASGRTVPRTGGHGLGVLVDARVAGRREPGISLCERRPGRAAEGEHYEHGDRAAHPVKTYEARGVSLTASDPYESFRLFQGRILQEYDKIVEEYGLAVVDATQPLVKQLASNSAFISRKGHFYFHCISCQPHLWAQ